MKTIIAGSRNIEEYLAVLDAIEASGFVITEVVSGKCRGVDTLGERYAKENSIPIKSFPADWTKYGKPAGNIRNKQMAEYSEALIAIWDGSSSGTENMIKLAQEHGLKVFVLKVRISQILKDGPRIPWKGE